MGDQKYIKDHVDIRSSNAQSVEELQVIQQESKTQQLPEQKNVFGTASLRKLHKAGNNLPDPTNPPLGFDVNNAFDNIFPFVRIPYLQPKTSEDVISFGDLDVSTYLDPKTKKIPLNAVFFGDNLHVLRALPSNSIDLIYIDPPFFSGREYNQLWGDDNEIRTFNDIWEDGLPSYLIWLNARLWEMRRVLKDTGSIYVHCDWHASHYIKTEMDKVFGYENFITEIIWFYSWGVRTDKKWNRKHDNILMYGKTGERKIVFNALEVMEKRQDEVLRRIASGVRGATMAANKSKTDDPTLALPTDVWNIPTINGMADERIGYPTQKPEALLEKIIKASSRKGDVIADFFMGGGTTCAVAMKLGRKFVGCDISRVAASVTLDRLVEVGEKITNEESSLTIAKRQEQENLLPTNKQMGLMQMEVIPSIHLFYVGIYPVERFNIIDQKIFNEFILTCYGARIWTTSGAITGVMNAATTILVGSHNSKDTLDPNQIRQFIQDSLKLRFNKELRMKLKIIAWSFPKVIQKYCQQLEKYLEKQGINVSIELIPINSEQFRHRITEQYAGKSITDSDFLLKFIVSPTIGNIAVKKISNLEYQFVAEGAHSNNLDSILINCQWDFDYKNGRFSEKEYALMREKTKDEKRKGTYKAVLTAVKKFNKPGIYTIACRVQDNFGAEASLKKQIEIK